MGGPNGQQRTQRARLTGLVTRLTALAGLLLGVAPGCGAGNALHGHELHKGGFDLRVGPVPPSWRPVDQPESLIVFRDDADQATVAVGGRCGKDGDDVPLAALTQHLFLYFTHRETLSSRTLELDGREALRTELLAQLDGVPKHFTVFVLKKDGCVYDFVYIQSAPGSAQGRDNFDRFVAGFSTLSKR